MGAGQRSSQKEVKIKDQGAEHFKLLLVVEKVFQEKTTACSHVFTVGSKVSQRPGVPLAKVGQVGNGQHHCSFLMFLYQATS